MCHSSLIFDNFGKDLYVYFGQCVDVYTGTGGTHDFGYVWMTAYLFVHMRIRATPAG